MKAPILVASLLVALPLAVHGLVAAEAKPGEEEFQAACPVSRHAAMEDHVLEGPKGTKIYFCCDNCPTAYQRNPERFALNVHRQLLETGQLVQVGCPISGRTVDEETIVEVGHAKAGFCCERCLARYESADDDGKLEILFADVEKGFTFQTKCPLSGKAIQPDVFLEHEGESVYFCCPACPDGFKADPEKYLVRLPQFSHEE